MAARRIAVLATVDTKLAETRFVAEQIHRHHGHPVVINLGTEDVDDPLVSVTQRDVRAAAGQIPPVPSKVELLESAAVGAQIVLRQGIAAGEIDAVLALGGGQGSWMAATALRELPLGFPRLLVSTAGRDVGQYTGFSDLASVFSLTDIAGLNPLLTRVLATAAAGICGMARADAWRQPLPVGLTAMTVYGITTPGARLVMAELASQGLESVAFHANGVGGPTMEGQIASGTFQAVLDWSITEVADDVVGGICAAGPDRLTHAPRMGLPQVIVPGGVDVVNFAEPERIPEHLRGRPIHAHTPQATLLRTNPAENRAIARVVADRIRSTQAPITVMVPLGGFSALSQADGPLVDPEADRAFFDTMSAELAAVDAVTVVAHPGAINSADFAAKVAQEFVDLVNHHLDASPRLPDTTRPGKASL
ncbi:MAG: Tm-1-like ATP-binding domain-containing protein [Propioniciclava sp.]